VSLKHQVKIAIARAWDLAARLGPRRSKLTILYYHAVPTPLAVAFDAQMAWLRRNANIVRPDHTGPLATDRPNVAVTFDDAFRSVRENALPALVRHKIPATIFVPTGYLGRPPGWSMETSGDRAETVMDAGELTGLPADLIDLGSHTVDHPYLTTLPDSQIAQQFTVSRKALERMSGRTIDTLAFPYGDHDGRVIEHARTAGYRFVYTVAPQAIAEADPAISRGRTSVEPHDSLGVFALKARGAFDWMPIASSLKRRLKSRS